MASIELDTDERNLLETHVLEGSRLLLAEMSRTIDTGRAKTFLDTFDALADRATLIRCIHDGGGPADALELRDIALHVRQSCSESGTQTREAMSALREGDMGKRFGTEQSVEDALAQHAAVLDRHERAIATIDGLLDRLPPGGGLVSGHAGRD